MPRHKKGTLVQVKPSALKEEDDYFSINRELVEEHGCLWVVVGWDHKLHTGAYICRSLSTGEEEPWFPKEITARLPKEQTHGGDV